MCQTLRHKLQALATCAGLFGVLVASFCPTCLPEPHRAEWVADSSCGEIPFADDWQGETGECACCESDGCTDPASPPDGLRPRAFHFHPPLPALLAAVFLPGADPVGTALPALDPAPLIKTSLHIQFSSFRC